MEQQKSIKQLNKKIKQLELELHTKKYIHIPMPSWKGFGKFTGFLVCLALSFFNFLLIKSIWITNNLGYVFASEKEMINYAPKFADLIVLYPLIGQYILISFSIIFFVSLFKELKSYDKKGLIFRLIFGLIFGLIGGLIVGLIGGSIYGLIFGLIGELIFGLIFGLIAGLILGLIAGLIGEFN